MKKVKDEDIEKFDAGGYITRYGGEEYVNITRVKFKDIEVSIFAQLRNYKTTKLIFYAERASDNDDVMTFMIEYDRSVHPKDLSKIGDIIMKDVTQRIAIMEI